METGFEGEHCCVFRDISRGQIGRVRAVRRVATPRGRDIELEICREIPIGRLPACDLLRLLWTICSCLGTAVLRLRGRWPVLRDGVMYVAFPVKRYCFCRFTFCVRSLYDIGRVCHFPLDLRIKFTDATAEGVKVDRLYCLAGAWRLAAL